MRLFFTVAWNYNNNQMRERATRLSTLGVPAKKPLFIIPSQSGYKWLWLRQMLKTLMNRIDVVSPTNVALTSLQWPLFLSTSSLRCFVSVSLSQKEKHQSECRLWTYRSCSSILKNDLENTTAYPKKCSSPVTAVVSIQQLCFTEKYMQKWPNETTFNIFSIVALFSWQLSN